MREVIKRPDHESSRRSGDSTLAVSAMFQPGPSCISSRQEQGLTAKADAMPTSKDTRGLRVDVFFENHRQHLAGKRRIFPQRRLGGIARRQFNGAQNRPR